MYEKILIIILVFIVSLKIIRTIFVTKSIKSSYKEIINTNKQIKTHQFQDIIVDIKKQRGDEGEKQLKQFILTNKNFGKATIFASKRLFDKSNNHKREIDIIIVTKKNIYIIECKNWAGQILSFNENSSKISYRSNSNSLIEQRYNPVEENNYKLQLLHNILNTNIGSIPRKFFVNKIIFINKNMVYPSNLENCANVITYNKLSQFFSNENTGLSFNFQKTIMKGIIHLISNEEKANLAIQTRYNDLPYFDKIIQYLNDLPTWDYITLLSSNGKKVTITGDLLRYENVFKRKLYFKNISNIKIIQKKGLLIQLILLKSNLIASIKWKDKYKRGSFKKIHLNYYGTILFHPAGSSNPINYDILDVDSITIGD